MSDTTDFGYSGGMFGGDPVDSATLEQQAPQLVPSSAGDVLASSFAQAFSDNPLIKGMRQANRFYAAEGPTAENPFADPQPPEADVQKDALNKKYGIPGVLSFDHDMPESIASDLYDHHLAEIQRQDVLNRNTGGSILSGGFARFLAGGAASVLDPLNIAAAFVPGVPEARVAALLGESAYGMSGRLAVRALTGASQGAAGMAALAPLQYVQSKNDQDDWDMGTALSQIAFGALIGAVLHPVLGEFSGKPPEWAKSLADQPPEIQSAMQRGAVAATVDGRPVDVAGTMDVYGALSAQNDLQAWYRQQQITEDRFNARLSKGVSADALGSQIGGDLDQAISEHTNRLTQLRADAEQFRTELSPIQDVIASASMDDATRERLSAIDQELSGAIPSARRLKLQAERSMITDGAIRPDDVEMLRSQAQATGLETGLARTQAEASDIEARLAVLKNKKADVAGVLNRSDASVDTETAKLQAREDITRNLAARTLRQYAGRALTDLAPGEADQMARAILTAKPGDTAAVIKSKLDYIASRSKRSAADAAFQDRYGQLYSDQEVLNNTTDRLNSTVQQSAQALADAQAPKPSARDVQSRSAIQRLIGNAPEITGDPVKDLPAVQKAAQQVDDFVNGEKQAGRWTEQDQNSLQRINDSAKTQEDLAEAYKSAAACLVAKGAIENV